MTAAEAILETIAEMVAAKIIAKLGATPRAPYTTAKSGPWAPGKTRAWMLRNVKAMPGAMKVGKTWMIAAEDFDRWATAQDTARMKKLAGHPPSVGSDEALADDLLARSGHRMTKGAA